MSSISYIEKNRGFVTASKLKDFLKSPEAYFRKYILETPLDEKDSKAFLIGTAFDDLCSYGMEAFYQKYWIDSGMTIADMIRELGERGIPVEAKESKDSLSRKLYGDTSNKIRLTAGDGETVIKMYLEATRQPLWDMNGNYEPQKEVTAVYKGSLKLKGTLDRFSFGKKMIRDYKTTSDLSRFQGELSQKFGYEFSMAFYYLLVKITHEIDCDVILDVVQSSGSYPSEVFGYKHDRLDLIIGSVIIPTLDVLNTMTEEYEKTGDESIWTQPVDRHELYSMDAYPILETAKQSDITYITF